MRRIALTLAAAALVLSGCSGQDSSTTAVDTDTGTSIERGTTDVDAIFIGFVRANVVFAPGESDASIIELAHVICDGFDHGLTFDQLSAAMLSTGNTTTYDVGSMIGSSVTAYCPEHKDEYQ